MKCDRCAAETRGYDLHDYCVSCSKNLCTSCMRAGCCGSKPAASGNDEADAEKVDAKRYQDMLEVLPPARWIGGAFLVGEAMSHDEDGQARYAYYFRRGDQHFHGADLTVSEFEAKHGKGG